MTDQNRSKGISRRTFVKGTSAAAGLTLAAGATGASLHNLPFQTNGKVLVNVFLRGAADGLSLCWPHGEPGLAGVRPNIQIQNWTNLDGYFGMPAALDQLYQRVWASRHLAIITAAGLAVKERSHFAAMDNWEFAGIPGSGWLGRVLDQTGPCPQIPIRGMAVAKGLPKSFSGGPKSLPVDDPSTFDFLGTTLMARGVGIMHRNEPPPTGPAVADTFATIELFNNPPSGPAGNLFANYTPFATYPAMNSFASSLKDVAAGIKHPDVNVDLYEVDVGGWDHHNNQDPNNPGGLMYDLMKRIGDGLAALHDDLMQINTATGRTFLSDVVIMVQTEFGRRVAQNQSLGTDHGWGGVMFVIHDDFNEGVYTRNWPFGQLLANLDDGDIIAETDHREIFYLVLRDHMGLTPAQIAAVLPGYGLPASPHALF